MAQTLAAFDIDSKAATANNSAVSQGKLSNRGIPVFDKFSVKIGDYIWTLYMHGVG